MSVKTILSDALAAYLSQMIMSGGLRRLSGTEPGTLPKWILPIIVPKGATPEEANGRAPIVDLPFRLTNLGFGIGFAGFLWYANREMDRAQLSGADQMEFDLSQKSDRPRVEVSYIGRGKWGIEMKGADQELYIEADTGEAAAKKAEIMVNRIWDKRSRKPEIIWMHHYDEEGNIVPLGDPKEMSEFWEPGQPELFKAKRTLTLEMEDIAKSDDPIFACMERRGYTQKQMDRLSESIAKKATVDIFDKEPEKLTSSENKFQNDIDDCIDKVRDFFGTLEAAGYEDCNCSD
jgi:hypothetical protein